MWVPTSEQHERVDPEIDNPSKYNPAGGMSRNRGVHLELEAVHFGPCDEHASTHPATRSRQALGAPSREVAAPCMVRAAPKLP